MKIIDLHQDLLPYYKYKEKAINKNQTSGELLDEFNFKITLPTANSGDYFGGKSKKPEPRLNDLIEKEFLSYRKYCESSKVFDIIKNKSDFDSVWNNEKKKGIIIHIEGIDYFEDKKEYGEMLDKGYSYGGRSLSIVWNIKNSLGGGTNTPDFGLTKIGEKVLDWSIEKEMIIDYAHMNRKLFGEVRDYLKNNFNTQYNKPVYVSHSAVDKIFSSERNLDDRQLEEIKKTNGVVGIFFANEFISDIKKKGNSTVENVVEHIEYIKNKIGIEYIGLGTDLGGYLDKTIEGLDSVSEVVNLENTLKEKGYSVDDIEKIFYKNSYRVIEELIKK